MDKKIKPLEEVAFRNHIATDMGNGGSYCSNCHYDLGPDPRKSYDNCPGCKYKISEGNQYVGASGSDF
jgi:predicted Zn-ribbon and HTH transcriptional regulator